MERAKKATRARHSPITLIATAILAALMFVLLAFLGAPTPSTAPAQHATSGARLAIVQPFVTPVTQEYVNRSQSGGTYINEYVTLNNSSTLTKIPSGVITVKSATDCRWITVLNLTSASSPKSVFHNVQYRNVTAANASGTLTIGTSAVSFKLCGGAAAWVNYIYWTYGVYDFIAPTLGVNATLTATFGAYPGTTSIPPTLTPNLGAKAAVALIVSSNLSFTVKLPLSINAPTTCDLTQQVCSYTQYTFVSATLFGTSNVNTTGSIIYGLISGVTGYAKASATYQNWTVGYSNASVAANTALGGFFAASQSFLVVVFVNNWLLWVILVVVIAVIGSVWYRHSR